MGREEESNCNLVPSMFCLRDGEYHGGEEFKVGNRFDVQDEYFNWFTGEILEVVGDCVLIRYDGFSSVFDEWFPIDSPRVQPLHTVTIEAQRSTGNGSGIFSPPPVGTKIQRFVNGNPMDFQEGKITAVSSDSIEVSLVDSQSAISIAIQKGKPTHQLRFSPEFNSPTLEDISYGNLSVGQDVDVRDEYFTWYTGKIHRIDTTKKMAFVSYDGWDEGWRAWVPFEKRVAPINTHTKNGTRSSLVTNSQSGMSGVIGGVLETPAIDSQVILSTTKGPLSGIVKSSTPQPNPSVVVSTENGDITVPLSSGVLREANPVMYNPATEEEISSMSLTPYQDVDVRDENFAWYPSTIIKKTEDTITVKYHNWSDFYGETIHLPSCRVAPLLSHSKPLSRNVKNPPAAVVPPSVGSAVLYKETSTGEYQKATIHKVEEKRVGIMTDDKKVEWLELPLPLGTLIDPSPRFPFITSVSSTSYGGVKINPSLKIAENISEPFKYSSHRVKVWEERKDGFYPRWKETNNPPSTVQDTMKTFSGSLISAENSSPRIYVIRRRLADLYGKYGRVAHSAILHVSEGNKYTIVEYLADGEVHTTPVDGKLVTSTSVNDKLYKWDKQRIGTAVPGVTAENIKNIMKEEVKTGEYDVVSFNCHMAQENTRRKLGVDVPNSYQYPSFYKSWAKKDLNNEKE